MQRKPRGYDKRGFAVLREFQSRRRHQVIRHLAPVKRRRAAHGVDYVLVETREKSEPMLAGHPVRDRTPSAIGELMSAGVLALVGHRNAASLASRNVAALEHHDLEAALDQFVRGTHACDAAAKNDDPSRHAFLCHAPLGRAIPALAPAARRRLAGSAALAGFEWRQRCHQ